ncbi:MAG: amino acid permease, partial [Candidatus Promineifilaceae bacterium]
MLWKHLHEFVVGPPLPSADMDTKRLDKVRALAALSPDALASIAYANQEIFLGLAVAGAVGLAYSWRIAFVITGLLALVTLSYTQTIAAYPSGGGSYTVARENLGVTLGLTAAAALLIDYVLNAAVSLAAAVAAVASAFPALWTHRTAVALLLLVVITLVNLRGLREAGTVMIVPVYLFLAAYLGMIAYGVVV